MIYITKGIEFRILHDCSSMGVKDINVIGREKCVMRASWTEQRNVSFAYTAGARLVLLQKICKA